MLTVHAVHLLIHLCGRMHLVGQNYTQNCIIFFFQVEDAWKTTEFIVIPHRDSKDVFILGGTDDIQVRNHFCLNELLKQSVSIYSVQIEKSGKNS